MSILFYNTKFSQHLNNADFILLEKYLNLLLEYNKKVNLVSRKITLEQLIKLVAETMQLNPLISNKLIIDAGSGNGLLGIPLAILNKNKNVVLIEKKYKKIDFLLEVRKKIPIMNIKIVKASIENYFKKNCNRAGTSIITRGFPDPKLLVNFLIEGLVSEVILITSEKKIRKMKKGMESIKKKTYNIPLRNNLMIVKMEYVSRETSQKQM